MKKTLILVFAMLLLFTGCSNNKENNSKDDNKSDKVTQEKITQKVEEDTEKSDENINNDDSSDEVVNNQQEDDNYSEPEENIQTEQPVQAPACTPKKFDNTYSYVYNSQDECKTGGNLAFMDITEDGTSDIFAYGCREIVDECGTTYYGVIFYNAPDSIVYR